VEGMTTLIVLGANVKTLRTMYNRGCALLTHVSWLSSKHYGHKA